MAIAGLPPHLQAQQAKQTDLIRRLNSKDPVIRYAAKQEAYYNQIDTIGNGLTRQAQITAEKAKREEEEYYRRNPWTR